MDNFMFDPRRHCISCGGMGSVGQGSTCQTCGGTGNTKEELSRIKKAAHIKWLENEFSKFSFSEEIIYNGELEKFIRWVKRN